MERTNIRDPERRRRHRDLTGVAVAGLFLLVGLATSADRGLTWDEPESIYAGAQNLRILAQLPGGGEVAWPWHELRGYQFVADTLRVAFAHAVGPLVGGPELAGVPIRGVHLFHLLLATATLLVVHRLALEVSGSRRIALLSTLVLAVTPKLVAHSQTNPKDLVGVFAYALFLWALERALDASERAGRPRPGAFAVAGAALGFAFASHVLSALLVPIAIVWVGIRLPVRPGRRLRDVLTALTTTGAASAAATIALWPWLWAQPLVRTARVARRVLTYRLELDVLYLGQLYPNADPPPPYFAVHLLTATPLVILGAAAIGAAAVFGRSAREPHRRLALLASLWAGIPMVVEAFAGARYDGVRHLLVVVPAVAVLAGVGLDRWLAAAATPGRWRIAARAAVALAGAAFAWLLVDLVRYHPYQDAYLNAATRGALHLLDLPPEEIFELEYWGSSYQEGAEWLNEHAEPGAVVHLPVARWCAEPYLGTGLYVVGPRWPFEPPREADPAPPAGAPQYLMVMTRQGTLSPELRRLRREREPVHTVERLGATLLEIYRLSNPHERPTTVPPSAPAGPETEPPTFG